MPERRLRLMLARGGVSALALSLALLPTVALAGASNTDGTKDLPRRHDGHPDLSGTYDPATLTPLERPARFGKRATLTAEEAAALAEHWRSNFEKDYRPSDPNREAPPPGGVGIFAPEFSGAAGKVGGYNAFFVDIGEGAFQIDGQYRSSIVVDPPDGRLPAPSAAGRDVREQTAPLRHENTGTAWWLAQPVGPYDDPELRPLGERCLLSRSRSGPPALPAMYNNLKRIVQTDDHVMILAEQMHDARIIRLDADHDPAEPPRWMGDSVGHWEGDTLVVDTTNFLETTGDPRTRHDLHVVERFTRTAPDRILYRFTVEDPLYEHAWTGEYPWPATDGKVYEYACHEGNYAMGGILRGARLLEREATGQPNDTQP